LSKSISLGTAPKLSTQSQQLAENIASSHEDVTRRSAALSQRSTAKLVNEKSKQEKSTERKLNLQSYMLSNQEIARLSDAVAPTSKFQAQALSSFEEISATEQYKIKSIIRQTIEPCWRMTSRSNFTRAKDIQLEVILDLNGSVDTARITNINQLRGSSISMAAAKSALRAILNPACQPFKLPIDKYQAWKNLKLTFNPRDIFAR
jgi:hypothetical protein